MKKCIFLFLALRVYQLATVHKKLVETIEIINGTGGFVIVVYLKNYILTRSLHITWNRERVKI